MKINFRKFDSARPAVIPEYKTSGSAGMDISSSESDTIIIKPFDRVLVPTNLVLEIPDGYEGQIRPRSGLAFKYGITVLNTPGTIDSDYRGEIKILLINFGKEDFEINYGERIAQIVIAEHAKVNLTHSEEITETIRGDGGYGSTGVH
ncbi:MAG: dUTP diphosphatase [Ignavibacteria bacterium]|nr:dUTP diphosphatase [Ignavibacteria bacterium]